MSDAEFDEFADEYKSVHAANITISGEDPEYFAEYKIRDLAKEYLARSEASAPPPVILDFGAGVGSSVPFVRKYFEHAHLTCLDVSPRSLAVGEERYQEQATFVRFDGARIPFPDATFDIAFAMCVFHHIEHGEQRSLLQEIIRVLRPGGIAFVFEHNPLNPLTVRAVNTCPFDKNARLIRAGAMRASLQAAGFGDVTVRYRVFFPRILRAMRPLEKWLRWLPYGAQYYAVGTRQRSHAAMQESR